MPNLVGIGNSQAPTNAMLGGLAYQDSVGEINIDKIKARTSDTATDIFVYDTSKDSDGGAWRHRTQNKSWYNEGASQKRGSRKEFPAVAVIVAEAREVTIYDGDDPNLSMWMIFDAGETTNYGKALQFWGTSTAGSVSSVFMLNGQMIVGTDNGSDNGIYVGMSKVDFLNDSTEYRRTFSNQYVKHILPISGRNEIQYAGTVLTGGLVGGNVNDVAMTVLPNAPIDASTGLPIPTIAVATDGGVSVIKDDGTVIDGTSTSGSNYSQTKQITFTEENYLWWLADYFGGGANLRDSYALSSDTFPNSNFTWDNGTDNLTAGDYYAVTTGNESGDIKIGFENTWAWNIQERNALGGPSGLAIHKPNIDSKTNSLIVAITSDYNTGWMHGDIKGAFLSSIDDTNLGTNLLTVGTFDSASGWTLSGTGAFSISGGKLNGNGTSGTSFAQRAETPAVITSGLTYTVKAVVTRTSGNLYARVANSSYSVNIGSTGTHYVSLTAGNVPTETVLFYSDGFNGTIDDVEVYIEDQDRSINNKGLQPYGTINKNPVATGAELVAYSGFTSGNYLQMTSGVLGVNTSTDGPLTVMCWYKGTTTSAAQSLVIIGPASNHQGRGLLIKSSTGELGFFRWSNDPYSSTIVADGAWHHCVATVETGSIVKLYVDGNLVYNDTITLATSSSTQVRIGYSNGNNAPLANGSLALVRISNSVASSDQIKKIYNDEKCLYHENAKCTLHGTSDAVTGLAFDDTNNVLHVGTSSGRSEFQGLNRINNTTTAVTTAISASNELVAEQ